MDSKKQDLGVTIDIDLKFYAKCLAVVNKANRLFGLIMKSFLCITPEMFTGLYKALVRPVLEYGNLIWGPHYISDMCKLEKILQKATRMVQSLRYLDYTERLQALKLPALQYRRYRGDMIALFNILHDKYDINFYY